MAKWQVVINVNATDDATAEKIAAFFDDALAEASDRESEDPVAGWDGFIGNAQVTEVN